MREKLLFIDREALGEIRANADWRRVFVALGIQKDEGRSRVNDWWAHSPFSEDVTPSFHMGEGGRWYCFSTGQGGGVIELVQTVKNMDCYAAARWLVENRLSRFSGADDVLPGAAAATAATATSAAAATAEDSASGGAGDGGENGNEKVAVYGMEQEEEAGGGEEDKKLVNKSIRQNLIPLLGKEHEELMRRGITPVTYTYLGCGFLAGGKSPLAGRIVFQICGVERGKDGKPVPAILTHIGRALTAEQEAAGGKWHLYAGFHKTLEVYNIDRLVLDERAMKQAKATGHVLIVEGCFDVAKLVEAGILNVGATFGAHLDEGQLPRLRLIAEQTGVKHFLIWYDRDPAGEAGQEKAVALINGSRELTAAGFDWGVSFPSPARGSVKIPETVTDPGEFSGEQLCFLRRIKWV